MRWLPDVIDGLEDAGIDPDAEDVLFERIATGPFGTSRAPEGRYAPESPQRPSGLGAGWPGHLPGDHASFVTDLGAWLVPPPLARRLAAALTSGRVETLLVATGPELGGVPWGLIAIPGVDGLPANGSTDPRRVMEAATVGVVPSVGFLASLPDDAPPLERSRAVIAVCDPQGDLGNARRPPLAATYVLGNVDEIPVGSPYVTATVENVGVLSGLERGCRGAFVYQGNAVTGDSIDTAGCGSRTAC